MSGALQGIRIIELAGIGPVPFGGMMLADHGAAVIQVDRVGGHPLRRSADPQLSVLNRSRRRIEVDLKHPEGRSVVRDLLRDADGLIEGFRPGVLEKLGLDPAELLSDVNPRLVIGRMTGWGQSGPLAAMAGHDINYLGLSGTLDLLGRADEPPKPPANLLGDFGGGGMLLAFAMVSGILHARRTGSGQVVDCAIVDGAALLASMIWGFKAQGRWCAPRGENFLDGGAHYYDTYECADGGFLAVGALEPEFYETFASLLGEDGMGALGERNDRSRWPALRQRLAATLRKRSRAEWCRIFEGTDACVSPVLTMEEALSHPHNVARGTFVNVAGVDQPAPAPRFTRCGESRPQPPHRETDCAHVLESLGYSAERILELERARVVA